MNDSATRLRAVLDAPVPIRRGASEQEDVRLRNLLARAAGGDVEAFMEFYDATVQMVWCLEARRDRSQELAEEAARRRYAAAWTRADEQAASGLRPRAWLLSLPVAPEDLA